jgi:diaminopimelate decarboxylase
MSDHAPTIGEAPLAARLVQEHFGQTGGVLSIANLRVDHLVTRFGSPVFLYDAGIMRRRYRALTDAVTGFASVYYSLKANPAPAVAAVFVSEGAGLEVASGAELLIARKAGCAAERILFAGPGKSEAELDLALRQRCGEIHLETFEEISRLGQLARQQGQRCRVAIRINPSASASGGAMRMGGKPTAFGFDEEIIPEVLAAVAGQEALDLDGVHVYAGTQILDAKVLLAQWDHGLRISAGIARLLGRPLGSIDLGGGLGIPYHDGDASLDLTAVRHGIPALIARRDGDPLLRAAKIVLEPGRYLVGPAGIYVMSVNAVKTSRGQRFVICDGGMHHHLAASGNLGQVVKRDFPIVAATKLDAGDRASATMVGPLCTPLDTLGRSTRLPALAAGDLVAVLQSGAYGLTASPAAFLSHPMPAEALIDGGAARLIRARGTFDVPHGATIA